MVLFIFWIISKYDTVKFYARVWEKLRNNIPTKNQEMNEYIWISSFIFTFLCQTFSYWISFRQKKLMKHKEFRQEVSMFYFRFSELWIIICIVFSKISMQILIAFRVKIIFKISTSFHFSSYQQMNHSNGDLLYQSEHPFEKGAIICSR